MKHNDLDLKNWKELDINTDSLWMISERDKSGKLSVSGIWRCSTLNSDYYKEKDCA